MDDLAAAEHVGAIGHRERQRQVLLDEQDRRPSRFSSPITRPTSRTISGARPSVGSSISRSVGIVIERPADGQHLLLAARELVRRVLRALAQPREELDARARASTAAGAPARGHLEILAHAQRRKDAPALRHQRHARGATMR